MACIQYVYAVATACDINNEVKIPCLTRLITFLRLLQKKQKPRIRLKNHEALGGSGLISRCLVFCVICLVLGLGTGLSGFLSTDITSRRQTPELVQKQNSDAGYLTPYQRQSWQGI